MSKDSSNLSKIATITHLFDYVPPVLADDNCADVLECFLKNDQLFSIPIVDKNNSPVGLVARAELTELFIQPAGRDFYQRKAVGAIMDSDPVIVDAESSIDELVQRIISADLQHPLHGFILTRNGLYLGVGTPQGLLKEIFNRKQGNLYSLAYYDSLTGLPNRLLFHDRLHQACQNANRNGVPFALIFVDLDHFKEINDRYGHSFGDILLRAVAERLTVSLRESDTVARLAGDEFVIILQNNKDTKDIITVCSLLIDHLNQPVVIHSHKLQLSASLGVAICPQHDQTPEGLVRKADSAMYDAKHAGRNRYAIYSDRLSEPMLEHLSLARHLKSALDNQELMLFYQPIVDLWTNQVIGAEALLRWQHPEFGIISPSRFIPIAEEIGVIESIEEWVLREACEQHCSWIKQGLPPIRMCINISSRQYERPDLCDTLSQVITAVGIDPGFIELEPTEKMLMARAATTIGRLAELRNIGIRISVDDFGIGYCSLNYLRQFQIDRIKIDSSFIRDIQTNAANEAIVRSIVTLGANLGLDIVAEGVETQSELECIRSHHCQNIQGHIMSRPLPPSDFGYWFRKRLLPYRSN